MFLVLEQYRKGDNIFVRYSMERVILEGDVSPDNERTGPYFDFRYVVII